MPARLEVDKLGMRRGGGGLLGCGIIVPWAGNRISLPRLHTFRLLNDQFIDTASRGLLGAVSSWNREGVWGVSSA